MEIGKAPIIELTQEQILGLIPAQALIDYDRAKEVLYKCFQYQRDLDCDWFLDWLEYNAPEYVWQTFKDGKDCRQ